MATTQEFENAVKWFNQNGIPAKNYNNEYVVIEVNGFEIFVSTSEVMHRAELWENENN